MSTDAKDLLSIEPGETEQITFEMLEELSDGKGAVDNE